MMMRLFIVTIIIIIITGVQHLLLRMVLVTIIIIWSYSGKNVAYHMSTICH